MPWRSEGKTLNPANVLCWIGRDASTDVSEAIEAADRREPPIDGRGRESALF
jgi:hypothetical protein